MERSGNSARNKRSLLAVGVLMMSLAALQGPLWRSPAASVPVTVRSGGATLITSDRPIAEVAVDRSSQATAEVVGDYQVLIRGKALGEAQLRIVSKDGHASTYQVIVQAESAKSPWVTPISR